jgi:hypothetical protein
MEELNPIRIGSGGEWRGCGADAGACMIVQGLVRWKCTLQVGEYVDELT